MTASRSVESPLPGHGVLVAGPGPLGRTLHRALGDGWRLTDEPRPDRVLGDGPTPSAVAYLACSRGRGGLPDAEDARAVLAACAGAGVAQLVVIGSAEIHEPSHLHPGMVREAALRNRRTGNPLAAAWRAFEDAVTAAAPAPALTLLRPVPMPVPGEGDLWSRTLFGRVAFSPLGYAPTVQLLAVEDLAAAIRATLERQARGIFHVAPRQVASARRAVRAAGALRIALPLPLWRLGRRLIGRPTAELEALRFPATVSARTLQEATGLTPRWSTLQAPRRNRGEEPGPTPDCDEFGFDPRYRRRLGRTLFRFLHDAYWRVEVNGLEHVPGEGRAILVGVHRGFQPWDGVMIQQALVTRCGRCPRFLMHPTLVKFPFLAPYMTKIGGLLASRENADWVLGQEEILGVYPEGIWGAFTLYRNAYRLTSHFRTDFAELAIRHQAPILPFVTLGSAEAFPILGRLDWAWAKRRTQWPYVPITTPVPLPSKWHTEVLPVIDPSRRWAADAAAEPEAVEALASEVREVLATALATSLGRRRWRFFGRLSEAR